MRALALLQLLLAPAHSLRVPLGASRREVATFAAASAMTLVMPPQAALATSKYIVPVNDDLKLLITKAKQLRATVRNGAKARRSLPLDPTPGVNNYGSLTDNVMRSKVSVLEPLRLKFKAVAADAGEKNLLTADVQKQLALQPLLMQGHMLELDQALKEAKFEPYTSKRTGKTCNQPGTTIALSAVATLCSPCPPFSRVAWSKHFHTTTHLLTSIHPTFGASPPLSTLVHLCRSGREGRARAGGD